MADVPQTPIDILAASGERAKELASRMAGLGDDLHAFVQRKNDASLAEGVPLIADVEDALSGLAAAMNVIDAEPNAHKRGP